MSRWRGAAIERLPEFRDLIARADNVMALWIALHVKFEDAYRDPRDDELIRRVYAYADWCLNARRSDDAGRDPATAVVTAFYEHIPTSPAARDDMPRWFRYEDVLRGKGVFAYLIGDEAYDHLVEFMKKNRHRYVER